jgi:hypothetical protein
MYRVVSRRALQLCSYVILVGETGRRIPLVRLKNGWEDNIKMNLSETWWRDVDWIDQAHNIVNLPAPVYTVLNLLVLWNVGKFFNPVDGRFSRRTQLHGVIVTHYTNLSVIKMYTHSCITGIENMCWNLKNETWYYYRLWKAEESFDFQRY